jgi:hypothetical protein
MPFRSSAASQAPSSSGESLYSLQASCELSTLARIAMTTAALRRDDHRCVSAGGKPARARFLSQSAATGLFGGICDMRGLMAKSRRHLIKTTTPGRSVYSADVFSFFVLLATTGSQVKVSRAVDSPLDRAVAPVRFGWQSRPLVEVPGTALLTAGPRGS